MSKIQNAILDKLKETEYTFQVKIPLAVESGSRGWGFPSPDSDYDCRFLYVCSPQDYLSIFEPRDVIEYSAGEIFDINGWDIKKAILHLAKSNAVLLEWLSSCEFYREDPDVIQVLADFGKECFNPISVSWHYQNMARKKLSPLLEAPAEAKLKSYFYILRPLAATRYIRQFQEIPPLNYLDTLDKIQIPEEIKSEILALIQLKSKSIEATSQPLSGALRTYIQKEFTSHQEWLNQASYPKTSHKDLANQTFRKIIEMMW